MTCVSTVWVSVCESHEDYLSNRSMSNGMKRCRVSSLLSANGSWVQRCQIDTGKTHVLDETLPTLPSCGMTPRHQSHVQQARGVCLPFAVLPCLLQNVPACLQSLACGPARLSQERMPPGKTKVSRHEIAAMCPGADSVNSGMQDLFHRCPAPSMLIVSGRDQKEDGTDRYGIIWNHSAAMLRLFSK